MLTEQMKELLTAFVDGELSQRQRKAVMRLLHKSSAARELVRELQENVYRVKQLPRRTCEPSLVDDVMEAIALQQTQALPEKPRFARRGWLPYVAASLAASVMIGAAGIFYWSSQGNTGPERIAKNKGGDNVTPNNDKKRADGGAVIAKNEKKTPDPTPTPKPPNADGGAVVAKNEKKSPEPTPIIEPRTFTAAFSDLGKEERGVRSQFARHLTPDVVMQLDITVKDNAQAMDHLRAILKSRGVNVITDPIAAKALAGKNQAKVEYLVYTENFTSTEVARLMSELAQEIVISQGNNEKKIDSPYKRVAVAPITKDDKQKLAKQLGVETSVLEPKAGKDVTPDPKRSGSALLLPTTAGSVPSAQVRAFVNQRRPQPGTMQVLIKIRQE